MRHETGKPYLYGRLSNGEYWGFLCSCGYVNNSYKGEHEAATAAKKHEDLTKP